MFLLSDLAGVTVNSVLTPSPPGAPVGTSGLALVFDPVPFPSSGTLDNSGSHYVGPWQLGVTTGMNYLLGPYQQTSLSGMVTSPLDNLQYIDVAHIKGSVVGLGHGSFRSTAVSPIANRDSG